MNVEKEPVTVKFYEENEVAWLKDKKVKVLEPEELAIVKPHTKSPYGLLKARTPNGQEYIVKIPARTLRGASWCCERATEVKEERKVYRKKEQ